MEASTEACIAFVRSNAGGWEELFVVFPTISSHEYGDLLYCKPLSYLFPDLSEYWSPTTPQFFHIQSLDKAKYYEYIWYLSAIRYTYEQPMLVENILKMMGVVEDPRVAWILGHYYKADGSVFSEGLFWGHVCLPTLPFGRAPKPHKLKIATLKDMVETKRFPDRCYSVADYIRGEGDYCNFSHMKQDLLDAFKD